MTYAHRTAYSLMVGEVPDGLQIDHLCRNALCVNPAHLEPVTPSENIRRAVAARKERAVG
ncbi:HNH endonuclease signature motif containing protein [Streptomyces sp. NPDC001407]|uniref:HNH endonuclease signature motif containing protein n=1 Tax=Streptomyces sp. NPDC001407 TaxID=3364573 RepID=UPI0036C6C791